MHIVSADQLLKGGKLEDFEYRTLFYDRMVMQFDSLKSAITFAYRFVQEHLIPKYGLEEAKKFPMAKTGPSRLEDGTELIEAMASVYIDRGETWLAVPKDRFPEVQEYIDRREQQGTLDFYDQFEQVLPQLTKEN